MKAAVFVAYLSLIAVPAAHAAAAEPEVRSLQLPMQGYAGQFREHCLELRKGQTLKLAVHSPYFVSLNVHHHAGGKTSYLLDEIVEDAGPNTLSIAADGEYCLEVTNTESRPAPFELRLNYQVSVD